MSIKKDTFLLLKGKTVAVSKGTKQNIKILKDIVVYCSKYSVHLKIKKKTEVLTVKEKENHQNGRTIF